jgi:hypothetical protein
MSIVNTTILNTNTTLMTVPSLKTYASVAICFCNYDVSGTAADETITVYFVPSGGSVGNATMVIQSLIIPIGQTYVFDSKMILDAGATVVAIGTVGSKVTATISYMSI